MAVQSDGGAWTRLTVTGSSITFNVGTRVGVAVVERGFTAGSYETSVLYGSAAELAAMGAQGCEIGGAAGKRLTGSVAGVGPGDFAQVQLGASGAQVLPGSTTFTLADVPAGPQDLVATRSTLSDQGALAGNRR